MERLTTKIDKIAIREASSVSSLSCSLTELWHHYKELFDALQKLEVQSESPSFKLFDMIDTFFSHNSIIALYIPDSDDSHSDIRFWRGMAHALPAEYDELIFDKFMGIVPESIMEGDTINIRVKPFVMRSEEHDN